jgi:adenylate cyclase
MGQVFLSYAREDLDRAKRVASALEKAGFSVWWDRHLSGGSEYSREIEQALKAAAAVVVLWSRVSVDSAWVRDEAAKGRDSGRLIPATLDGTEPPLGFGQLHTIDLQGQARRRAAGVQEIVTATKAKVSGGAGLGVGSVTGAPAGRAFFKDRLLQPRRAGILAAMVLAVVVGVAVYLFNPVSLVTSRPGAGDGGTIAISRFEALSSDHETQRVARLASDAMERTFATNFIETLTSRSATPAALLDADFQLNGTVDRQSNELIASASIIDSKSGQTVWATEHKRPVDDGRPLANELAISVADVLRCAIYAKSRMQKYRSAEVESRILKWCEAERSRHEQFDQLPGIAQELVEAAPKSGQAYAYLAMGLVLAQPDRRRDIYSAARRALELDPNSGGARFALAAVPDPRVTLAERERINREGMRLDPGLMYNRAHLAALMMTVGRMDEARDLQGQLVSELSARPFHTRYLGIPAGAIRKPSTSPCGIRADRAVASRFYKRIRSCTQDGDPIWRSNESSRSSGVFETERAG